MKIALSSYITEAGCQDKFILYLRRPGGTSVRCCSVAVSFSWLSSYLVLGYVTEFLDAVVFVHSCV
jgi:hypothetical protein